MATSLNSFELTLNRNQLYACTVADLKATIHSLINKQLPSLNLPKFIVALSIHKFYISVSDDEANPFIDGNNARIQSQLLSTIIALKTPFAAIYVLLGATGKQPINVW